MALFAKRYFSWRKPRAYDIERFVGGGWIVWLVLMAAVMVMTELCEWLKWLRTAPGHRGSLGSELELNAWVVCAMALVLPCLMLLFRTKVVFFEDCLKVYTGRSPHVLLYGAAVSHAWEAGEKYATLVLRCKNGRPLSVQAPLDVPREAVSAFLEERGVRRSGRGEF